jgi:hypothetical protein
MRNYEDIFFIETEAVFTPCTIPTREPDYVSDSGSEYWYTEDGVIRYSNHWGSHVGYCNWYFGYNDIDSWEWEGYKAGYCAWSNFVTREAAMYDNSRSVFDRYIGSKRFPLSALRNDTITIDGAEFTPAITHRMWSIEKIN